MGNQEIKEFIVLTTLIFLLAPAAIIVYIFVYNRRKKTHIEEKALMKITFESEIIKAQYEVQEQTMQTIGADLHDNIGQLLSLTSLTLNSIELNDEAKAKQKVDAAIDLTLRSIKEMRQLGKLLQGDQLIIKGLPEAIRYEINWLENYGKYQITYVDDEEMPAVNNPQKDLIVFRVLQEMLNNIIKHAQATSLVIKLTYPAGHLQLEVNDNGIGFNIEDTQGQTGMGIQNMQKRIQIIGGELNMTSKPLKGTCLTVLIPYP